MNKKQEQMLREIEEIQVNAAVFKARCKGLDALVDDEAERLIKDRIWDFIEVNKWK